MPECIAHCLRKKQLFMEKKFLHSRLATVYFIIIFIYIHLFHFLDVYLIFNPLSSHKAAFTIALLYFIVCCCNYPLLFIHDAYAFDTKMSFTVLIKFSLKRTFKNIN